MGLRSAGESVGLPGLGIHVNQESAHNLKYVSGCCCHRLSHNCSNPGIYQLLAKMPKEQRCEMWGVWLSWLAECREQLAAQSRSKAPDDGGAASRSCGASIGSAPAANSTTEVDCSGWRMHLRAAMEGGKNLLAISFVLIFFFMTREKFSMFASQLRADSNGFRRQASCSAGNCDWVSLSGPSVRSEPCMQILMACLCEFAAAALRRQC